MHFLVTGHSGFKGSWLTEMLLQLGHSVSGISFETDPKSLYSVGSSRHRLLHDLDIDIRDRVAMASAIMDVSPDFVIHFAAQALVRKSYIRPTETFDTNFTGTMNVLLAAESVESVTGALIITTDKVYRNDNSGKAFKEADPLGANDPYSASKAAADIFAKSFATYSKLKTVVARAGNVIGGGDVCLDRLVPDLVAKIQNNETLELRYPEATRPWQHVLDCLDGYLTILSNWSLVPNGSAWNVGPEAAYQRSVLEVVQKLYAAFDKAPNIKVGSQNKFKESLALSLDVSKLYSEFGHGCRLTFEETIDWTANFHKRMWAGETSQGVLEQQVKTYISSKSLVDFANLRVEKFLKSA